MQAHTIGSEIRKTLVLAIPLILAQLAQMSMSFVDTLMVGRLGERELAGVALGGAVFFPVTILFLGVLLSVSPMVSQAFGGGEREAVSRAVRQGLWLATLLALPAFLLMWNVAPFLLWMGQDAGIVDLARSYLHAIAWGTLPLFWFAVLRQFAEGLSRPRVVMAVAVPAVGVNALFNYILMFGKLGFPPLGLVGCGWASTLVYCGMLGILALALFEIPELRAYRVFSRLGHPDPHYFSRLFRIGWPIGVTQGLEVTLFAAAALMMGRLGTAQLAAHQIALNCAAYTFMVPLGLSLAVAVRVGQAAGRKDLPGVRRAGSVGMALAAAFMTLGAIAFWTLPQRIIGLFIDVRAAQGAQVLAQGTLFLGVAAFFQIFDGIQVTAAGALRGLKDTRVPMLLALLAYWLLGLTAGWFLAFRLGWGGVGVWWGLVFGLTSAAGLLGCRFYYLSRPSRERLRPGP